MDKVTQLQEQLGKLQFMFYNHLGTLQRDFKQHTDDNTAQDYASQIMATYSDFLKMLDELPEDLDLGIDDSHLATIDKENRAINDELRRKEESMHAFRQEIGDALENLAQHSLPSELLTSLHPAHESPSPHDP